MMNSHNLEITGLPEENDTYSSDDEPTVKVQVPTFLPRIEVALEGEDEEEDTLIIVRPVESKYPGIGLLLALTIGTAMWFLPAYYFLMWVLFK